MARWHPHSTLRQTTLPRASGVYAVYERGELAYIGSSMDIRTRFNGHRSKRKFQEPGTVVKIRVMDKGWIDLEAKLVKRLRPKSNYVINVAMRVRGPFNY